MLCIGCMKHVGLDEMLNVYPAKLSGGLQRRVAIACALATSPDYRLRDEVTSLLDPPGQVIENPCAPETADFMKSVLTSTTA